MQTNRTATVAGLALVCLMTCMSAFSSQGDKIKTKGMIISRTGETLVVNSPAGKTTVILTEDTKTKDNKGMLGLRKEYMANTVLIPGLKVDIEGVSDDQGRVVAGTITVDGDDLETAEMIQAGLNPTAQQVTANTQDIQENTERFSKLGEYEVKAEATVKFKVGSSEITPEDMNQLKALAQTATALNGYLI